MVSGPRKSFGSPWSQFKLTFLSILGDKTDPALAYVVPSVLEHINVQLQATRAKKNTSRTRWGNDFTIVPSGYSDASN